ncbi:MAG: DUF4388 domain-containing protein, partial [Acidobacteriota bacterium]
QTEELTFMALTGHLSDLSLSELIEFFCNQRKTGRLKVLYPQSAGYFYLQAGSVVDARLGVLRGIDAVYFALTLPNAKFEFSGSSESSERTINQPWTQVVLEGLRRLDEGITPEEAFPVGYLIENIDNEEAAVVAATPPPEIAIEHESHMPAFLAFMNPELISKRKPLFAGAVVVALLASVAVIGVPAGWYNHPKAAVAVSLPAEPVAVESQPVSSSSPEVAAPEVAAKDSHTEDAAALALKRQHEKDRAKAREGKANLVNESAISAPAAVGQKKVTVTVTYDESGRVIQASGGDPSALRIARQKRFPPGKGGSATVTIPIH